MARPYCARCETEVILDSDGLSCPNCGTSLIPSIPSKPPPKAATPPKTTARSAA